MLKVMAGRAPKFHPVLVSWAVTEVAKSPASITKMSFFIGLIIL